MIWLPGDKSVIILLLAGLLLSSPATAEMLVGTVLSIEKQEFTVRIRPGVTTTKAYDELRVVPVLKSTREHSPKSSLPPCVRVGKTVRLYGQFNDRMDVFLAKEIRGMGGGRKHRHDPTGVRGRLGRCRKPLTTVHE